MSSKTIATTIAALAAATLAAPALGQADTTTYYFKCSEPSKVQNIFAAVQPAEWTTVKPTASFQSGAGCGFADFPTARPSTTPENAYDAWYRGVHPRAVAKATIELHNLVTSRARQGDSVSLLVRLSTGTSTTATTLAEQTFTVKPVVSSTGATEKVVVELTGLEIPAEEDRTINITVHSTGQTPQAWVHDAAEIPASVTFTEPPPPAVQ